MTTKLISEGGESMVLTPPRTLSENLQYRHFIRSWALKSEGNRRWLIDKCQNDLQFWLETFVWLYEPRPDEERKSTVIPFIPWDHQLPALKVIDENLGYRDIGLEKARGEGATWMCLMIILRRWLFADMQAFGLVSRNEMAADNSEDPDSLGWKLDWQLQMLPSWMAGKRGTDWIRNIQKHTWINKRNGSSITAYPATGDLASGGRKTAFFMDELSKFPRGPDEEAMAATEPVTNSRLLVSTPAGADGAYYRCMTESSSMLKLILDWTKNPTRNKNLFRVHLPNRQCVEASTGKSMPLEFTKNFFDKHLPILSRRGFNVTDQKKIWSPWYVERCLRPRMTPKKIAQEYDRDYGGTSSRFFPSVTIEALIERTRDPKMIGDLLINNEKFEVREFTKMREGRCKLWCNLINGKPPIGEYVVGADIATGIGGSLSSNSVIIVGERTTGKKVMEYASPIISPESLAALAVSVSKWFVNASGGSAYLIWESNGAGGAFRNFVIKDTSFRNFYYRQSLKTPTSKPTKEPGWWSGKDTKRDLLSHYRHALIEGHFDNPSEVALRETLNYEEWAGGRVMYVSSSSDIDDPANEGENHGDRVIADALCNFGIQELNGTPDPVKFQVKTSTSGPPIGSFGYRRKIWEASRKKSEMGGW